MNKENNEKKIKFQVRLKLNTHSYRVLDGSSTLAPL